MSQNQPGCRWRIGPVAFDSGKSSGNAWLPVLSHGSRDGNGSGRWDGAVGCGSLPPVGFVWLLMLLGVSWLLSTSAMAQSLSLPSAPIRRPDATGSVASPAALPPSLPGAPPAAASSPESSSPMASGLPSDGTGPASRPVGGAPSAPGGRSTAVVPQVRYIVENGIRYQETRTVVRQPVRDVRYEERQQTGYQQRYRTDVQRVDYYTQVPVTQYEWVPRLYDWWRVFRGGYVAYGMEPYTTFQTVPQSTQVPMTRREVRPFTRTVKVAVPYVRYEDRVQVARVALGPAGSSGTGLAASGNSGSPTYVPPTTVTPGLSPSPPPSRAASLGRQPAVRPPSIPPSDSNPFGSWGVATRRRTPPNPAPDAFHGTPPRAVQTANPGQPADPSGNLAGGTTAETTLPPPPNPTRPAGTLALPPPIGQIPSPDDRYGGVAAFDEDPPRFGSSGGP